MSSITRLVRLHPLILPLLLVVLLFGRTARYEFVNWDDGSLVTDNRHVNPPGIRGLVSAWKAPHEGMYIPLTYNAWNAIAAVAKHLGGANDAKGLSPLPFHLANILAHMGVVALVWLILRQCGFARWPAAFGAAVFGIHPLVVEPVAWVTGMKDLLSALLATAGIAGALGAAKSFRDGRPARGHQLYSLALVCMVLGVLAKPGILGAAIIVGVLDVAFISGWRRGMAWRTLGLVLVMLPSIFWTSLAQPATYDAGISVLYRPLIALHALGFYLTKVFIPSRLCTDYGLTPIEVILHPRLWLIAVLPAAYLLTLLLLPSHRKILAAGGLVMLAGVAPVLGLIPFGFQYYSTVADRYMYLSMIGVAMAAAYLLTLVGRRFAIVAGIAIVVGLGAACWRQVGFWQNTITLMSHTVRLSPNPGAAYNNLALAILPPLSFDKIVREYADPATRPVDLISVAQADEINSTADSFFMRTIAARPGQPGPLKNMIMIRGMKGQYREALQLAELLYRLAPAHDWDPSRLFGPYEMGWLHLELGHTEKAKQWFLAAFRLDPSDLNSWQQLRKLYAAATTQPPSATTARPVP